MEKNGREKKPLLLGRYEVGKLLGQGNFAKVYYAVNKLTADEVAIKVIDKEKIFKSGLVAHIKREIAVLRRVRHPNIVQLFEVMATKSKIYFVMEYVRGGELFNKVAKGRLREELARKYFQQLIAAVAFCHARGVYHRDIKPENLLLDENGDLKVSDFGLSAVADQMWQDGLFHTFCGTPAYVAPEVLAQKGYDAAKADVWSCGVVLFALMAGYLPFQDPNLMVMYRKIYKGEFRSPRWFSPDLIRLLHRILDTNPSRRITIPEIMENRWFRKDLRCVRFYIEGDTLHSLDDTDLPPSEPEWDPPSLVPTTPSTSTTLSTSASAPSLLSQKKYGLGMRRPASLNAFDIISFSAGFDLSGLFEEKGEERRFVSGAPVRIARTVSFTVRTKDCRVSLEGTREGEKGRLSIVAEIFELTPSLVVVEVRKKAGDRAEYEEFCDKELAPGLRKLMYGHTEAKDEDNDDGDDSVEDENVVSSDTE
ncbi:CBL-interacting serine/threonine-protein kinase 12-like [Ananas comosus]|uniref:non-specific serine/threonine protein kinase n=1 Tax=Ananas comosus TaxID=4615 RepID=A0A6P5FNF0_ANACO|nr:CBL-interacting serine/threonine-protein kinase 12-like [Ananas comosus]